HRRFSRQAPGSGESLTILDFRDLWVDSAQLAGLSTLPSRSPSFPHALRGNPGGFRTGSPTKAFRGDAFKSAEFYYIASRCSVIYLLSVDVQNEKPIGFSLRTQSLPY